jgi:hypothetical protein
LAREQERLARIRGLRPRKNADRVSGRRCAAVCLQRVTDVSGREVYRLTPQRAKPGRVGDPGVEQEVEEVEEKALSEFGGEADGELGAASAGPETGVGVAR